MASTATRGRPHATTHGRMAVRKKGPRGTEATGFAASRTHSIKMGEVQVDQRSFGDVAFVFHTRGIRKAVESVSNREFAGDAYAGMKTKELTAW